MTIHFAKPSINLRLLYYPLCILDSIVALLSFHAVQLNLSLEFIFWDSLRICIKEKNKK